MCWTPNYCFLVELFDEDAVDDDLEAEEPDFASSLTLDDLQMKLKCK